ncbi:hypothetical protein KCU62_g5663, partial [Aureobasidium sp. EXF-3399]
MATHQCTLCLRDGIIHTSNSEANMKVHLGSRKHNLGEYICQVVGCDKVTYRIGRHINHRLPTAHQPSWVVDQNRLRALDAAVKLCELPLTAAAPGLAPPAAYNTAPVAPVPGPAAHGSTTAGAQAQTDPSGTGQDQTNPPGVGQGQADLSNTGDDDDEEQQDEEYEQDHQPDAEVENNAVEEQEEEQEQDNQLISTNNHATLVAPASADTNLPPTTGAHDQSHPRGAGQGQANLSRYNPEDWDWPPGMYEP